MNLSEKEGIEKKIFAVTGGLGLVGSALCLELVRRGAHQVRAFDIRPESPWSHDLRHLGVHCIQGDVSNKQDVEKALDGADCVFHLASYGKSGKQTLHSSRVNEININGTCHVLDACLEHGVKRVVYVSTYNVVYGGKEIINGNESLPYFPINDHTDPYGRSKSIAEQLVLKSNGQSFKTKKGKLYTCAIRPAAIYGPGEERYLPRIMKLAKLGLLHFKIGEKDVKSDWVYVDNLVLGLLLASMGLLDDIPGREGHPVAAGQPYFISDGSPVNSFEFIRPLLKSVDYDLPKLSLAVPHALLLGKFFRLFYSLMYPWLNRRWLPEPFILPTDVYKVGVTHYFSFLKAKEELGYRPAASPEEGMAATISYWKDRKRRALDGPTIYPWIFLVIGLFLFGSIGALRVAFVLTLAGHIGQGVYAWKLARKVDPVNARGWFWQTLALGFLSLRYLLKRAKIHTIC